jgi:hypothetical protein
MFGIIQLLFNYEPLLYLTYILISVSSSIIVGA